MSIPSTNFNLTQPNYQTSALPGPYRSQPSLLEPNFLRLNPLEKSGDYFSYFALDNILDNNHYASYGQSPNQLQFPSAAAVSSTPADQQLKSALELGADYMTPEQNQALTPIAKSLGFASAKNMVHSLRYVPEETRTKILDSLASRGNDVDNAGGPDALKQMLKSESHHLVYDTFERHGARPPELDPPLDDDPEGMWEAPHLLAIYNNFKTMEDRLPTPVVKDIMEPDNGEALVFQRKKTPERSGAEDNLLKSLSSAMKVAETDQQNTVTLFDSAFTINPEDIVQSEDVQDFLNAYEQVKDSEESSPQVKSVQEMLNNILPADRKLPLTGVMDRPTVAILAEFEGQQFLKQAQDIFEDDKNLSLEERQKNRSDINQLQQAIFKEGYLNAQGELNPHAMKLFSFVQDLNKTTTNLTPASKARLNSLVSTMETRVSAKTLNPELLEGVVSNWFGIIDSGERKDFAEQVITHELGHFWENKNNVISNWKQISFQDFENDQAVGETNSSHVHDDTMASTLEIRDEKDGFASSYAKLNSSEDFAESFRLFNRDPEKLIQQNLLKYMMLAGSMGTYAGDNDGLISFAKKNGYSDKDIAAAVEKLRGHQQTSESRVTDNTPFTQDQEVEIDRTAGSAFEPTAMHFPAAGHEHSTTFHANTHAHDSGFVPASSTETAHPVQPTMSVSSGFTQRSTAAAAQSTTLSHEMKHAAAAVGESSVELAFDLSVANYFPGIEKNLEIAPAHVGDPSKPGFILDNLAQHTENMEKSRLFSRSSRDSHRFIDKFKKEGANAFPAEIRDQIPQAIKDKFESSQNKAIYLVMAKLRSSPELADAFVAQKQEDVSHAFFDDNFEDLLSGLEVPEALKNYVSQPENLVAVTGNGGKSFLAAETVERNMGKVVIQQQEKYTKSLSSLTQAESSDLASSFTASGYLKFQPEKGFSLSSYAESIVFDAINNDLKNVNFGKSVSSFNHANFQQLGTKILERLNEMGLSSSGTSPNKNSWKNDPTVLQEINKVIVEELNAQVPEMQKIMSDKTG